MGCVILGVAVGGKGMYYVWRNLMEAKKYVKGNKVPGVGGRMTQPIQETVM